MSSNKNPTLGTIACSGCGGQADVCQTSRGAGRYLYTRCAECGTDQRTGAKVQTAIWYGADWLNGAPDVMPPNLILKDENEPEEPEPVPPREPATEPGEASNSGASEGDNDNGWLWLAGGAIGLIAMIVRGG